MSCPKTSRVTSSSTSASHFPTFSSYPGYPYLVTLTPHLRTRRQGNPIPPVVPPPGAVASTSTSSSASTSTNNSSTPSTTSFPGAGKRLAGPSTPSPARAAPPPPTAGRGAVAAPAFPEAAIATLVGLGVGREEAIRLLEASGGNPELAANLIFSGGFD
ncbi:hypothetical protein T439DRAFT_143385 [Meredithblackwellia eburnea MCA 4105]